MTDTGTTPLRALRDRRGWTQQDVARQLDRLAVALRGKHVGVNADMVAKWERGVKAPNHEYRQLLAVLFDVPSDASGGTLENAPRGLMDDASIGEALTGTIELMDDLGPEAHLLMPRLRDEWREQIVKRRSALKLLAFTPVVLRTTQAGPNLAANADTAASLRRLADNYQQRYHSTSPYLLMTPVLAHLETVRDLLRGQRTSPSMRSKLLANQAQVALLAGRLSFFDLRDSFMARGFLGLAIESAEESDSHLLASAALGHLAFLPAAEHNYPKALSYLDRAKECLTKRSDPRLSSWLAAVGSEVRAEANAFSDALRSIDEARSELHRPGLRCELGWFDFFDEVRLDAFAGYCHLHAGMGDDAITFLETATMKLPARAIKQQAVVLSDLASTHLLKGDLDQACAIASDAADRLRVAGYATGLDRIRNFRAGVTPWATSNAVRSLDEHLVQPAQS